MNGKLETGTGADQFRQVVRDVLEAGESDILLNMESVGYNDSAGTDELVASLTASQRHGANLKLLNPNWMVRDLLRITLLDSMFEMFDEESAALASFDS